jgi:hypothetical protein
VVTDPNAPRSLIGLLDRQAKVLALGALIGVVAAFMPLLFVSAKLGGFALNTTVLVIQDFRGDLCLIGSAVNLYFIYRAYIAKQDMQRNMVLGWMGAAAAVTLSGIWLFANAVGARSSLQLGSFGGGAIGGGIGVYFVLLAAIITGIGGAMKARAEKLF